jgi:hypothetical protein
LKTLIQDKPSKHYLKWLVIILILLGLFSTSAYRVKSFFSKYGIQSPIILRSFLYVKTAPQPIKTPKASPKPSESPTSLIPVALAAPMSNLKSNEIGADIKTLVLSYFPADQRDAVEELVQRESTWNPNAVNSYSGATGLFQALPWSKTGCDSTENIQCQASWGEAYIRTRYGDANKALAFQKANGYY